MFVAFAVAPDSTWLADRQPRRDSADLGPPTGQPRAALTGHHGAVTAVAIAPDGTWLATSSGDGTARIWDSYRPAARHPHRRTAVGDRGGDPPDGTWLATGSTTVRVRTWDTGRRQPRATLTGHTAGVTAIDDRPGRHLARHRQRPDSADLDPATSDPPPSSPSTAGG